jgi:actin related protein 2/3 complex subunit 2
MGLIHLDTKNAILREQLARRILDGKREPCVVIFSDFDDVGFKVECLEETLSVVKVNMSMRNFADLRRMGSQGVIDRLFAGLEVTPDEGYTFAIQFNCDTLAGNRETFLDHVSDMKRHLFGGPMDLAFTELQSGAAQRSPARVLEYRRNEHLFICPSDAKVVVVFQVDFADVTDKAIAKVFLQEFMEAQRSIRSAPPVSYSPKDPPGELTGLSFRYNPDSAGFISFALEKRHVEGARKDIAVTLLTGFRNYLHYHIKCSKTYLHMRMRKKGAGWMQVLNRAIPEVEKEKKTIEGKTFLRK